MLQLACTCLDIPVMGLRSTLPCAGEAAACMSASDRRLGEVQRLANALFWHVLLNMLAKHEDDARQGIQLLASDSKCKKVLMAARF